MDITPHDSDGRSRLAGLTRGEKHAMQRDRFRAIALALDREMTTGIEGKLGRSKAFVQRLVYADPNHGLDATKPGKAAGNKCRLTPNELERFRQRVIAGPTEANGVCTLRGPALQRILSDEFSVEYSLNSVYALLHRLGLLSLGLVHGTGRPLPRRKNS